MRAVRRGLCLGAVAVAAMLSAVSGSAEARGTVSVGIGFGLYPAYPSYPAYPTYDYYRPHRHYRPPPVVMYAPPPPVVLYRQPPPVVYAPPPSIAADPAGPIYRSGNGQQCREYQSSVTIGGRPQPVYGTACLQADGTWRIVD